MSIKVMSKVFEWSEAEGTDRLVMLALADFCDDDHVCFPGIARVAKKCRVSERTVQRSMTNLEATGELERVPGAGLRVTGPRGPGYTNAYKLAFPKRGCQSVTPNPEGGDRQGSKGVTPLSPKSSVQTVSNTDGAPHLLLEVSKNGRVKPAAIIINTAETIYGHYPKKVGKPIAIKAIIKALSKFGPGHVLERTMAFSAARRGNIEFVPNPATWFNQERFNDDPATWKPSANGKNGHNGHAPVKEGEPAGWKEWLADHPEYHEICNSRPYSGCREFIRREFLLHKKASKAS